jgi:hypothetical protein
MTTDSNPTLVYYLQDLSVLLLELFEASKSRNDDYEIGRHLALLEVISLMQQQADLFGIPRVEIGLPTEDVDS